MQREDRVARRENPDLVLPGVKSVIMVGMIYWPGMSGFPRDHRMIKEMKERSRDDRGKEARGIVSCYAWGEDYHKILGRRLKLLGRHLNKVAGGVGRFYVDTGAILERDFGERAGLGFVGKNSLLINPRVGSGFFIGELFSSVELVLDGDEDVGTKVGKQRGKAGCGSCKKCRIACPTDAIVEDHVVDARRCISYLTIELKGSIPIELRKKIGSRIYGCDICQLVCPWNRIEWEDTSRDKKYDGYSPLFGNVKQDVSSPLLTDILSMCEESFEGKFGKSAVRRIGRDRLARNAAVALGNIGGANELEVLQRVSREDTSEIVREHAQWGVTEILNRMQAADKCEERKI